MLKLSPASRMRTTAWQASVMLRGAATLLTVVALSLEWMSLTGTELQIAMRRGPCLTENAETFRLPSQRGSPCQVTHQGDAGYGK